MPPKNLCDFPVNSYAKFQLVCMKIIMVCNGVTVLIFSDENEDDVDEETNERLENRRAKAAKVAKVSFVNTTYVKITL